MKKKTKILTLLLVSLLLFSLFSLFAFASEGGESSETDESIFTAIYGYVSENADKIFSILAFIGAIILSFAYKKGLFPFVEKSLTALTGAVGKLREETENTKLLGDSLSAEITNKLALSENVLNEALLKLSSLEERLSAAELLKDKNEKMRAILEAEVEMLYEIFISSSLPQYQKDKIGEAYAKMKAQLTKEAG